MKTKNLKNLSAILMIFLGISSTFYGQNVGIGTASPGEKLDVSASGNVFTRITSTNAADAGLQFYRPGLTLDYQIYDTGGQLKFSAAGDLSVGPLTNILTLDGLNNEVEVTGSLAVGTTSASHTLTVQSTNDEAFRLIGPDSYGHGGRINFGDGDYAYIEEDLDDQLLLSASNRTALMGGYVGIGTLIPYERLEVNGRIRMVDGNQAVGYIPVSDASGSMTWTNPASVFSGDNLGNHSATQNLRLNGNWLSGDGGNEGISVDADGEVGVGTSSPSTDLEVYGADPFIKITNTRETFAGLAFEDAQTSSENAWILFTCDGSSTGLNELAFFQKGNYRMGIHDDLVFKPNGSNFPLRMSNTTWTNWVGQSFSMPMFSPSISTGGLLGNASLPWASVYSWTYFIKTGFVMSFFDTYDDLALLNAIEADTFYDASLQHHVMVMKEETIPKLLLKRDTQADGSPGETYIDMRKFLGLTIGSFRQLDKQTKDRDRRLEARTDILAEALSIDFQENRTITKTLTDQGSSQATDTEIRVLFSEEFQSQLPKGQEILVHITPRSWYQQYMISSVDEKGFVLKVKMDQNEEHFTFNWQATTQLVKTLDSQEDHMDDIFYKEPIEIKGDYPILDEEAILEKRREASRRAYDQKNN